MYPDHSSAYVVANHLRLPSGSPLNAKRGTSAVSNITLSIASSTLVESLSSRSSLSKDCASFHSPDFSAI